MDQIPTIVSKVHVSFACIAAGMREICFVLASCVARLENYIDEGSGSAWLHAWSNRRRVKIVRLEIILPSWKVGKLFFEDHSA
jgi:hypothetical protein